MKGVVYLLHFAEKYCHAQHYRGWTDALLDRLARHRAGNGSKLVRAVLQSGIDFVLARTWEGDRSKERRLKRWKKSRLFCPICTSNPKPVDSPKQELSHGGQFPRGRCRSCGGTLEILDCEDGTMNVACLGCGDNYVVHQGAIRCDSDRIEGGPIDVDGQRAVQAVTCLACGERWHDVYVLTDIE